MDIFSAALMGLVQGLTEFLPVSSSGHLVLAQKIIPGFDQPGIAFEVILHAGTLLAILFYFRSSIFSLSRRFVSLLILGTIPAVIIGFLFQDMLEGFFDSVAIVGFALLITGIINIITDKNTGKNKNISTSHSLLIGLAQAIAIIPGISRSGSTIFAATSLGISKEEAAKFSFLLSVPAVIGANVLELISPTGTGSFDFSIYFSGFLAAALSGYFAIGLVFKILTNNKFNYFGVYCLLLGLFTLLVLA